MVYLVLKNIPPAAGREKGVTALFSHEEIQSLNTLEMSVYNYVSKNREKVISRESLLDHVWGFDFVGETNAVDVYIRFLRSKIDEAFGVKLIHTVRGVGYVMKED